ncbi:hypothetical protein SARC_08934 [Sphaeroforma arctica JP610]|uniref:PDZ-like domain-containing protein n=1 Tax=Sphaeroforma arctica JP610 TaxID=667725 RepID=A0A0L0FRQ5_9EUKA|nr:hypothetical protein SARC_08934 [Sphaeroforma arctica JP610]KNC78643.1 hypothetical protein SARC_08934 [Sphaeroforma arctica JP610]|eukprot:XP_014152545.1 hypothetical protein SARC_08934 [Sphaeroforma arctica JP610]
METLMLEVVGRLEQGVAKRMLDVAASGTSGGSSGSPVIDSLGRAIALNAGGKKKAASSFYLPLDRVVRRSHSAKFIDGNVGDKVSVSIQRGASNLVFDLQVQDLHALTPTRFLEMGDCIFHDVSYQLARAASIPCQGVYVSKAGYILRNARVGKHVVVKSVGGILTPNLREFEAVLLSLPEGSKRVFRFQPLSDRHREATKVVTITWRWHRALICERDKSYGIWNIKVISPPPQV